MVTSDQKDLCRVHTAQFSKSSDRRCFHIARLSGVAFSRCCFHIARLSGVAFSLCCFHIARLSGVAFSRCCFHIARLSGVAFSLCCFHIARLSGVAFSRCCFLHCTIDWWQEVSHCMILQREESPTTLSGPQTTVKRTREVKEIMQDHADIMVYMPSPNIQ